MWSEQVFSCLGFSTLWTADAALPPPRTEIAGEHVWGMPQIRSHPLKKPS